MKDQKELLLTENDVFAVYRLPNEEDFFIILQNSKKMNPFDKTCYKKQGFVIFPYDKNKNEPVFIQVDKVFKNIDFSFKTNIVYKNNDIEKQDYIKRLNEFITAIKLGFRKIVLSRTKSVPNNNTDIYRLFRALDKKYKNAFVFLVNHPGVGTWMGATPETLLSTKNKITRTIALAGTQYVDNPDDTLWEDKEIEEQKSVMDFIEKILKDNNITFVANGPNIKIAARNDKKSLVHLATDYTFQSPKSIFNLISQLHPTPAVSGFPKKASIAFINKNEGYDREYYTGYLGPINIDEQDKIDLFVNLRSMKVFKNNFLLFLGGGLNSQSIPEKEWEETQNKAKTLEEVINSLK